MKKFAVIAILVLAAVVLLKAQEGAPPPAAPAQGGPDARNTAAEAAHVGAAERGRSLFKQNCAACHAEDATGGRGPDLIRSTLVRHDKNGDLIGPVVMNGRVEKGMPAFSNLTSSQIGDIVAFIQSQLTLFDLHTRFGPYPNDIPSERLATGSVEAGKAYFDAHCSSCHSPTGDLAHVASKYNPPDLEVRFLYPSGAPSTAVVMLPDGKRYEGTVLLNDGFYIGIQGRDGWYRSWPANSVKVEVQDPLAAHAALLDKYTDADMHNMFTYLETLQ